MLIYFLTFNLLSIFFFLFLESTLLVLSEETKTVELKQDEITSIVFENEKIKGYLEITKIAIKSPISMPNAGIAMALGAIAGSIFNPFEIKFLTITSCRKILPKP